MISHVCGGACGHQRQEIREEKIGLEIVARYQITLQSGLVPSSDEPSPCADTIEQAGANKAQARTRASYLAAVWHRRSRPESQAGVAPEEARPPAPPGATQVGDPVHKWHERAVIGRVGHELVRDDHLMRGIDRDLAVVALHEAITRGLDPAVRISEVAMRSVGRTTIRPAQWAALPAHPRQGTRLALVLWIGRISRLRFQRGLSGADCFKPRCLSAIQSGVSSPRRSTP